MEKERAQKGYPKIFIHTDAAQAIGKIKVDVSKLGVDYLTIVGHKFYGPRIGDSTNLSLAKFMNQKLIITISSLRTESFFLFQARYLQNLRPTKLRYFRCFSEEAKKEVIDLALKILE